MSRRRFLPTVSLLALAAAGCATTSDADRTADASAQGSAAAGSAGGTVTEMMQRDDARLQTYRIRNWSVPDDRTLIVEALDGTRYRAQMLGSCIGLRFADTIGFETRGTNALDDFSGVRLRDGTRCAFSSFERISSPAQSASGETEDAAPR